MLKTVANRIGRWRPFAALGGAPELKNSATKPLMAINYAGKPVWTPRQYDQLAREGFMKNPVAYRCIRMIAEACASVPLRVEVAGKVVADHPLQVLLDHPNPEQGGAAFRESLFGALQTAGNAYVEAVEDAHGRPLELWGLRPDRVKIVPNARGWPEAYEYGAGNVRVRIGRDGAGWLKVLHLKFFHPLDDWYGFSPLEAAAFSIDVHNASGAWNKALLDNAARPSGALVYSQNMSERMGVEQFADLKAELMNAYTGSDNAGRPLLLEGGLDWKPMALSPAEMDFIDGKYAAARDIALSFGVPTQLLGIPGDNSYANYKEANLAFWRHTVLPLVERQVEALNGWLGPRFGGAKIVSDNDGLAALSVEREALWNRLEQASFLTRTERRKLAGLSAVEDGQFDGEREGA